MDLFHAVQQSPRDVSAYRVLADALQARGDPWGELIGLQCSLEREQDPGRFLTRKNAAEALRQQLEPRLLGAAYTWREQLKLDWKWGFVRNVTVAYLPDGPMPAVIDGLLSAEAMQALQSFTAGHLRYEGGGDFAQLTDLLTRLLPRSVRELHLGGNVASDMGAIDQLLAAHPQLGTLGLVEATATFDSAREPALEQLMLEQCGEGGFRWLERARWPRLEALVFRGPAADHALGALIAASRFPVLTQLTLDVASIDEFLRALDPNVFAQLAQIELDGDLYGDTALEALIAARTKLNDARRIQLRGVPQVTRKLLNIAKKQLPNLTLLRTRPRVPTPPEGPG